MFLAFNETYCTKYGYPFLTPVFVSDFCLHHNTNLIQTRLCKITAVKIDIVSYTIPKIIIYQHQNVITTEQPRKSRTRGFAAHISPIAQISAPTN